MAQIIFITGGSRSGKSSFAQGMAESLSKSRCFIATCPVIDDELRDRIRKHRRARLHRGWRTLEEPLHLTRGVRRAKNHGVLLVDCLTLWINNLMFEAKKKGASLSEEDVVHQCRTLLAACKKHRGTVLLVSNEVGMGIIPENPISRLFRDLAGRCNQIIASAADEAYLLVSNLPVCLKKQSGLSEK